jgi:hypothetical protein
MRRFFACLLGAIVTAACASAAQPPGNIQFDETTNLGFLCSSGALSTWTVTCDQTQEAGSAMCEQPILFARYNDGQTFTFVIDGYGPSGQHCWSGSCAVPVVGGTTVYPDCHPQIHPLLTAGCP